MVSPRNIFANKTLACKISHNKLKSFPSKQIYLNVSPCSRSYSMDSWILIGRCKIEAPWRDFFSIPQQKLMHLSIWFSVKINILCMLFQNSLEIFNLPSFQLHQRFLNITKLTNSKYQIMQKKLV